MQQKNSDLQTSFSDGRDHSYTAWEKELGAKPEQKWLDAQKNKETQK